MKHILQFLIFFFISSCLFAQGSGSLKGTVVDSLTGEVLYGANVFIPGTALGGSTNIEGEYQIPIIKAGDQKIRVSYIGYKLKDYNVKIEEDKSTILNITIVPDVIKGEEVIVLGQAAGQSAAINQQRSSNTIINVISEEKIKELPDANAAEAIGRLPGVSILRSGGEANKIILRGLGDQYTNITIDGVKVPPTDATSRGVDLSTFSQSTLAGIELYKALTPDKDADALAGSVNLVTKKAPDKRSIRLDSKGDYNSLMKSAKQYDFSLRYGERFLDNLLGVQVTGNIESRIRSNERINVNYNQTDLDGTVYWINNFFLEFTDETRERKGLGLLLDFDTPDEGTIRVNNIFNSTRRDYLYTTRDFPSNGAGNNNGSPSYDYRDREQEIENFSSSVRGDNHLVGLDLNWGVSFSQSNSEFPFDFEGIFVEPAGMYTTPKYQENPGLLIDSAKNVFSNSSLYWSYYRTQKNLDNEKTAFLNIAKKYTLGDFISGEFKLGGKYKSKTRTNNRTENLAPYYLSGQFKGFVKNADGSVVPKDFSGTYFEDFWNIYQNDHSKTTPSMTSFFKDPTARSIYGKYSLNPLIDKDRLKQWYELNKNGVDNTGNNKEIWENPLIAYDDYNITEAVTSGYLMNTLNLGQFLTVIAGVRVESEDNKYLAKYMESPGSGFPILNTLKDTASSAKQTVVLPNLNISFRPLEYMNIRLAAYKALARPDFNMRIDRYTAGRPAETGTQPQVYVGNINLKTSQAWNYEINTSFFGNEIGLLSLSAYYKEIKDMYHMLNNFNTKGDSIIQQFGISWPSKMNIGGISQPYNLTLPYNSPKVTKVWGFEFEHQINFIWLPGLFKNIVLSYNASIVRSEAYVYSSNTVTYVDSSKGPGGKWYKFEKSRNDLVEIKQKLENMPEFFGNIALGYDYKGFSGRISVYHKSKHDLTYSANRLNDRINNAFTRLDISLKQKFTDYLSAVLNINNITNIEEGSSIYNRVQDWTLFDQSEKYGTTADFGITLEL